MGRLIGPKHKLCRFYGEKLCDSPKCPSIRRNYPSGVHGERRQRAKLSGFAKQLREKQKAKRIYGILERQFANYVAEASHKTGDTSKFLLTYLESRLDNVVYRSGLAKSRAAARQLVGHGHVLVNSRKVDIPSFRVKPGLTIALKDQIKLSKLFEGVAASLVKRDLPAWLSVDPATLTAKVLNTPTIESPNFDANQIVGFYSR